MRNFLFFLCLIFGIILGHFLNLPYLWLVLGAITLLMSYLFYRRGKLALSDVSLLIFFVVIGCIWISPLNYLEANKAINRQGVFSLKVVSLPKKGEWHQSYRARLRGFSPSPITVWVRDYSPDEKQYLSNYEVEARLKSHQYHHKTFYRLWIKKDAPVLKMKDPWYTVFLRAVMRGALSSYKKYLSGDAASLLASVFLGRRELLSDDLKTIFKNAGAMHLLAISGLHIGLVSAVLFYMLKVFRIPYRRRIIISIFGIFIYTFLVGASPATLRSSIMYSMFGVAFLLRRKTHPLNTLGSAGLLCLLFYPQWLLEVGFQLSFIAVFGIIFCYRFFKIRITSNNRVWMYVKNILFSSLFVNLFIFPLGAYYFGKVTLLGIVANVVLIPLFISVICTNIVFLILSPWGAVAWLLGESLSLLSFLFIRTAYFFGELPFSTIAVRFSLVSVGLYYLALAALLGVIHYLARRRKVRGTFPF